MEHTFLLKADWNGGRNSAGYIEAGQLRTAISIPAEMGGPGVGTNPDEMLLGAAATCYLITLAAMMERAGLPVASLALESEGIVDVTNNIFAYRRIIHRPRVQLVRRCDRIGDRTGSAAGRAGRELLHDLTCRSGKCGFIYRARRGTRLLALFEPGVIIPIAHYFSNLRRTQP